MSSFIIGVAGASASGKSTVTEQITRAVGKNNVTIFMQDNYYLDRSHLTMEERDRINFDHPDAFDWSLMKHQLDDLAKGITIEMPQYDFNTHTRSKITKNVGANKIIVVEGIFGLYDEDISKHMTLKIFVDTAADICLIRRLRRDIQKRGRSVDSVIEQYTKFVRPMYKKFVAPTKRCAHIIIPHGSNKAALEMIVSRIHSALNGQELNLSKDWFFEEE